MKITMLEVQPRDSAAWDGETLGWILMIIVAVAILSFGAWEVREMNQQLAYQASVAVPAE